MLVKTSRLFDCVNFRLGFPCDLKIGEVSTYLINVIRSLMSKSYQFNLFTYQSYKLTETKEEKLFLL